MDEVCDLSGAYIFEQLGRNGLDFLLVWLFLGKLNDETQNSFNEGVIRFKLALEEFCLDFESRLVLFVKDIILDSHHNALDALLLSMPWRPLKFAIDFMKTSKAVRFMIMLSISEFSL